MLKTDIESMQENLTMLFDQWTLINNSKLPSKEKHLIKLEQWMQQVNQDIDTAVKAA